VENIRSKVDDVIRRSQQEVQQRVSTTKSKAYSPLRENREQERYRQDKTSSSPLRPKASDMKKGVSFGK
jgi:hypothetical protein